MTQRLTQPPPGPVACFAPHPDDEILGPGGALCLHLRQDDPVTIAVATDGIAGDPEGRFERATYAERRRAESRAAAASLGAPEPRFFGLPDSCEVFESDKLRVIELVTAVLRDVEPATVYLPWRGDDHTDHLVLHEVVVRALQGVGFAGAALGYEVWAPNPSPHVVLDITDVVPDKRRALDCFATQQAYADLHHAVFGLNAYRSLLLERSGGFGEAFERVAW